MAQEHWSTREARRRSEATGRVERIGNVTHPRKLRGRRTKVRIFAGVTALRHLEGELLEVMRLAEDVSVVIIFTVANQVNFGRNLEVYGEFNPRGVATSRTAGRVGDPTQLRPIPVNSSKRRLGVIPFTTR